MTRNRRLTLSLASVAQSLPIITGVCLAVVLSPEKASAQGWVTQYSDDTNNDFGTNCYGTGQCVNTVLALGPNIAGAVLASSGGPLSAYSEMRGGTAATVTGNATYYDAQGRPAVPNSGYTWTGTMYSATMFTVAASYSTDKSTGLVTPVSGADVYLEDNESIAGNSTENLPPGDIHASSIPNSYDTIGSYVTSQTGNVTLQWGPGVSTAEVAIGGVYYFQNGNLSWASQGGNVVWLRTFTETETQAGFQQGGGTSCGTYATFDHPVLYATGSGGSSAGIITALQATVSGSPSFP